MDFVFSVPSDNRGFELNERKMEETQESEEIDVLGDFDYKSRWFALKTINADIVTLWLYAWHVMNIWMIE